MPPRQFVNFPSAVSNGPVRELCCGPNHTIMHGAGKFGLASLCNLDRLPATGAVVLAAPLKIVRGSGSPVRVLALVPASTDSKSDL